MGPLPILIGLLAIQVTWVGYSDGAVPSTVKYHRPHGPAAGVPASSGMPPVKPLPRKAGPTSTPATAKAPAPAASVTASATSSANAKASASKEDRYLHSLTKITTFMVKLNSFLELTIGSITKQLTDLTSQMAEVRGSLENLVNNTNTQPSIPSIPPPVPALPVLNLPTTPKPTPPPPPPPLPPSPPRQKPIQRPALTPAPRPATRPSRPIPVRQTVQRYMPSYPMQFKPAVVPAARKPAITQQRRMDYYRGSGDKSLRWPGNNEFHPWWKNWWSNNFQGFYPETSGDTSSASSFGTRRSQFGSTSQFASGFGGQSSFGETSQFGAPSQFGSVPQFGGSKFSASSQFGSVPQYGASQFGSFGSYPGGAAAWMSASQKSREPGETEGKGRSSSSGSGAEYR